MLSKRERLTRFISRLRSKRTGSSLVVQTGFPTSLADLVVKNRAKFQKRKKPSLASDLDSASSVAVRSGSDGSDDCQVTAVKTPDEIDREVGVRARRRGGLGLRFLMVKVVALVVLAFGMKWVVGGITILAFGVLVFEFLGLQILKRKSLKSNAIKRFDLGGREMVSPITEKDDHQFSGGLNSRSDESSERRDFEVAVLRWRSKEKINLVERELVSPIREIEPKNQQSSLQSETNLESSEDSRVFGAAENVTKNQHLGNSRMSKRKKLFKNLFKRKNRDKQNEKDSSLNGSRSCKEEIFIEEGEVGNGGDVDENSDENFLCFQDCNEAIGIDSVDIDSIDIGDNGCEVGLKRLRKYVSCIVVLLGLLGGKGLALFLTIAWYLLSVCTGTLLKKWKMRSID